MPNAFVCKPHEPRLNNIKWDKYYFNVELKDRVVKTGEGDEDFVIEKKEVITKTSIKEVIDSQANDVGLDNILRKFALTGDESILPQNVNTDGRVLDMSGMPEDLVDAQNYFAAMKAKFDSLPADLVKGRSFDEFMSNLTQAEYDAYFASIRPKEKEVKKDGEE